MNNSMYLQKEWMEYEYEFILIPKFKRSDTHDTAERHRDGIVLDIQNSANSVPHTPYEGSEAAISLNIWIIHLFKA